MDARPNARCPRCGYDLSGVAASWRTECPLDGTCSECGLAFAWRDVLNPRLTYPSWSFEHATGLLPLRLVVTIARANWPWTFWKRIRMEHPIRAGRLAVLAVVLLLGTHAMVAATTAYHAYEAMSAVRVRQLTPGLGLPGPMAGSAMSTDQVRSHALRAGAWPYATTRTTIRQPGGGWMGWATAPIVPPRAWLGTALISVIPLAYLLLGQTMRRARVRRAHLVRIWLYSLVVVPWSVAAWIVLRPPVLSLSDMLELLSIGVSGWSPALHAATLAAGGLFWWCATSRYLRLPHAGSVAGVLSLLVGLAGLTGLVLVGLVAMRMGA